MNLLLGEELQDDYFQRRMLPLRNSLLRYGRNNSYKGTL